jgi:predicted enzyme related to lactoylglutathione lyase
VGSVINVGVVDSDVVYAGDNIVVEMDGVLAMVLAGEDVDVPMTAAVDEGGVIVDGCFLLEDGGIMLC